MLPIKYSLAFGLALLSLLCFVATAQGRLLVVGDITIKITKNHFRCDRIACPPTADRCVVTKENQHNDLSTVLRSNICYSKMNQVVKKSLSYQSFHGKTDIKVLLDVQRNGQLNILSSNDFDEKRFNDDVSKFEKGLSHDMGKLNKDMQEMEHELEHMFV